MITLKNMEKRRFVFSLYHEHVCRREGTCSCDTKMVPGPGGKLYPRNDPLSMQIDGLSVSGPLPDSVYNVPQVWKACHEGRLQREQIPVEQKVTRTPAPVASKKHSTTDKE
jgi:hypothetical protein